ncbi:MAG: phosphopentomutase [Alphaproteobacteria bacterium]|nr:MAG: phosphopentomutase [Alphaproteobacteria bacterium]
MVPAVWQERTGMPRAFIIVLDSVGIGGAPDAARFGDEGADTLGHIAAACMAGAGDRDGLRRGRLLLPHMERLGLGLAARGASGALPAGFDPAPDLAGICAHACEVSNGKDTPSGHWEIAGLPVPFDWGYFPRTEPCFPAELTKAVIAQGDIPGILGNRHASGTTIIEELGEEHIRTGKPICYTSADSVFQIAAHETHFGLDRLYQLCRLVRRLVDPYNIGRVIARPFVGETPAQFERTGNRRDYAVPPPEPTLLDRAKAAGREVIAIGKVDDIFAHRGPTRIVKGHGNEALFDATLTAAATVPDGSLAFTNLVDFDQLYGHRRDVPGYAAALEAFDRRLPELTDRLREGDLLVITADHGNDPTWRGTDHTREQVPVLACGPGIGPREAGRRDSFADIGETVAEHLELAPGRHGRSFLTG